MKKLIASLAAAVLLLTAAPDCMAAASPTPVQTIVSQLKLTPHPEGGWFSEVYTSPATYETGHGSRALAGSIYYLLEKKDRSQFHQIDCDEVWYYHEGCGMRIYLLNADGTMTQKRLGMNGANGETPMVIIPAKTIFAAENLDPSGYTLISCMTTPKFQYQGWRLVDRAELLKLAPKQKSLIERF